MRGRWIPITKGDLRRENIAFLAAIPILALSVWQCSRVEKAWSEASTVTARVLAEAESDQGTTYDLGWSIRGQSHSRRALRSATGELAVGAAVELRYLDGKPEQAWTAAELYQDSTKRSGEPFFIGLLVWLCVKVWLTGRRMKGDGKVVASWKDD